MSTTATPSELWGMLETLADDLESTRIRVPNSDDHDGDASRQSLLADIRRYFAARLNAPGAPIVVAITGPSGVGVSSIVNALAGEVVSPSGVLRPTTKEPVLWAPYGARGRWWDEVKSRFGVVAESQVVVGSADREEFEWILVDVPAALGPSESLDLAACADLCVFVSSPARYADAEAAALAIGLFERGVPTWFVLNKLPEDSALRFEMAEAYAGLLHSWSLLERPSPELLETAGLTIDGIADAADLVKLRATLASLADDDERRRILEDAVAARLAAVSVRTEEVAESIEDDRDSLRDLAAAAADAYAIEAERLSSDLEKGGLVGLAGHSSWLEAAVDLSGILTRRAGLASQKATEAWDASATGRTVLADGGGSLRRHGEHSAFESQGLLEAWYDELGDLAASASSKRVSSRKRSKLARWLWPLVVDPQREVPRRVTRWLGPDVADTVSEARSRLAASMVAALERDGARFEAFLGPAPNVGNLGRIITTASLLSVIEPVGLDRESGPAWGASGAEPMSDPEDPGGEPSSADDGDAGDGDAGDRDLWSDSPGGETEPSIDQPPVEGDGLEPESIEADRGDDPTVIDVAPEPGIGGRADAGVADRDLRETSDGDEPHVHDPGIVSEVLPEVPSFVLPVTPEVQGFATSEHRATSGDDDFADHVVSDDSVGEGLREPDHDDPGDSDGEAPQEPEGDSHA